MNAASEPDRIIRIAPAGELWVDAYMTIPERSGSGGSDIPYTSCNPESVPVFEIIENRIRECESGQNAVFGIFPVKGVLIADFPRGEIIIESVAEVDSITVHQFRRLRLKFSGMFWSGSILWEKRRRDLQADSFAVQEKIPSVDGEFPETEFFRIKHIDGFSRCILECGNGCVEMFRCSVSHSLGSVHEFVNWKRPFFRASAGTELFDNLSLFLDQEIQGGTRGGSSMKSEIKSDGLAGNGGDDVQITDPCILRFRPQVTSP